MNESALEWSKISQIDAALPFAAGKSENALRPALLGDASLHRQELRDCEPPANRGRHHLFTFLSFNLSQCDNDRHLARERSGALKISMNGSRSSSAD